MSDPTPEEIAWAAGLFEGEGCFTIQRTRQYRYPVASLQMTDEDTVRRFYDVVGVGRLYLDQKPYGLGTKTMHQWRASARADFAAVVELLSPWLGKRRLARVEEIMEEVNASV